MCPSVLQHNTYQLVLISDFSRTFVQLRYDRAQMRAVRDELFVNGPQVRNTPITCQRTPMERYFGCQGPIETTENSKRRHSIFMFFFGG